MTSSTPYDPPLSYGGWLQSRALGSRIINEVRSLEDQLGGSTHDAQDSHLQAHRPRERKQKPRVIIHTSPFLRCVQTAIAISSGINQNYTDLESLHGSRLPTSPSSNNNPAIPESISSAGSATHSKNNPRSLLRVDACLGEWLNPEYFESIIPPPKSERMVAAAKTELLRRDDSIIPAADKHATPTSRHFPGDWSSPNPSQEEEEPKNETESAPIPTNPGQRNRAGSYDSLKAIHTPWGRRMLKVNTDIPAVPDAAYSPPIPSYAISPSNPIPDGYVTHARDACVLVDYQWDSMREPQNWGSGGEYGDEWSTMLTRFSNSIERMISWYENDDASTAPLHRRTRSQLQFLGQDEVEDSAGDTILIIVTHGAGCNALIGALSGQPTLVNVATASFTLAVRKDCMRETSSIYGRTKVYDSRSKISGPEDYSLVEVASTDHLRPGTSPSASIRSPITSSTPPPSIPSYRHRSTISSGPILLSPSLKPGMGLHSWTTPRASSGLWSSVSGDRDTADDLVPNFGSPVSPPPSSLSGMDGLSLNPGPASGESTPSGPLPQRTPSQRGLWRSAPLNKERSAHSNRRWTVAERPL